MTNPKYYVFSGTNSFSIPCIYIKRGGLDFGADGGYVNRSQLEGISKALDDRLNGLDPLQLFIKEIASGSMGLETIISGAKELLREDE